VFNEWWETAPTDAIAKYEAAILNHPEHGPQAREAWLAPDFRLAMLDDCAPGTLGHTYRARHEALELSGKIDRMPPAIAYKVVRGFQTHDLHHVLIGYPATPFGELALQAFQLAQMDFPYAAMWIAVVSGQMALVDPLLIQPAMDAISDGWSRGRRARSLQFVAFEKRLHEPLDRPRREYGLDESPIAVVNPAPERTPDLLAAAV
jgi:ubiquinone biosynthesis protein Coq4